MLSILIPLRDEVENLPHILRNFEENIKEINYEVIFVNDFSKDDTFIEAKKLSDRHKNYLVFDNKKKGLGGAINLGISHAKGDYICIVMADLSDDVNDIKKDECGFVTKLVFHGRLDKFTLPDYSWVEDGKLIFTGVKIVEAKPEEKR